MGVSAEYRALWGDDGRVCTGCREFKPWAAFGPRAAGYGGRLSKCRGCMAEIKRARRADPASRARENATAREWERRTRRHVRRRYGLTADEYEAMELDQGGLCAACGEMPRRLVVDHDHDTDEVRALLCDRCNIGLSVLETPGLLDLLTAYLERHAREEISL